MHNSEGAVLVRKKRNRNACVLKVSFKHYQALNKCWHRIVKETHAHKCMHLDIRPNTLVAVVLLKQFHNKWCSGRWQGFSVSVLLARRVRFVLRRLDTYWQQTVVEFLDLRTKPSEFTWNCHRRVQDRAVKHQSARPGYSGSC